MMYEWCYERYNGDISFVNNNISTCIRWVKQNVITICKLKLYVCFQFIWFFCILSTLKSNFLIFEHKCRFSLLTPLFVLHNKGIARNITIDAFKFEAEISMLWLYYNHTWIYFSCFIHLFHVWLWVDMLCFINITFSFSTFILYIFKIQSILYNWIP